MNIKDIINNREQQFRMSFTSRDFTWNRDSKLGLEMAQQTWNSARLFALDSMYLMRVVLKDWAETRKRTEYYGDAMNFGYNEALDDLIHYLDT
jgi:hypothetical protein